MDFSTPSLIPNVSGFIETTGRHRLRASDPPLDKGTLLRGNPHSGGVLPVGFGVFTVLSRIEQQILPSRCILIVGKKRLSGRIQYKQ
jgi:hypothetical protein